MGTHRSILVRPKSLVRVVRLEAPDTLTGTDISLLKPPDWELPPGSMPVRGSWRVRNRTLSLSHPKPPQSFSVPKPKACCAIRRTWPHGQREYPGGYLSFQPIALLA